MKIHARGRVNRQSRADGKAAHAKKARAPRWGVYILGKKSERVGDVYANTEEEALEKAKNEMQIAPALQFKLAVRRE